MDEEMTTLNANVIWELMILSKNKKNNQGQMVVQNQTQCG
jgi:hypothetical protein